VTVSCPPVSSPAKETCPRRFRSFQTIAKSTLTTNARSSARTARSKYLLIWDDAEWNSVKDWIRVAEAAVRRSHRLHGDIEIAPTIKFCPSYESSGHDAAGGLLSAR
jgi:hypothetical protein